MTPLDAKCEVCDAKPGQVCHSLTAVPLNREFHTGRTEIAYCIGCGRSAPVGHHCGRKETSDE